MTDSIFALIEEEEKRQQESVGLIPSENTVSRAVRTAVGSVLMHKYAEGVAGARYYQGNAVVDEVEGLCKRRALQTFGLDEESWSVNVQPYSGSPANLAIYNGLLEPGDKILSMFLPDGGHLSHGWQYGDKKVSIVSKFWEVEFYKTNPETQMLDYDEILVQAEAFKPKMIVSGGTAYPREIDYERMAAIAGSVKAYYLADVSHEAGLIAGGVNKSPFGFADVVMMTTHKTLRGPRGAMIFAKRNFQDEVGMNPIDLSKAIDISVFPGVQGGPHIHTIAGIAVALEEAQTAKFKNYAAQVVTNARTMASRLVELGYRVVSGGTDKHLVLVDLRNKELSGWVAAWALEAAGIVVNRNTVPQETASPFYPSGIRIGTPLITTRGMKESEVILIVDWIDKVLNHIRDKHLPDDGYQRKVFVDEFVKFVFSDPYLIELKRRVIDLCEKFPIDNSL